MALRSCLARHSSASRAQCFSPVVDGSSILPLFPMDVTKFLLLFAVVLLFTSLFLPIRMCVSLEIYVKIEAFDFSLSLSVLHICFAILFFSTFKTLFSLAICAFLLFSSPCIHPKLYGTDNKTPPLGGAVGG